MQNKQAIIETMQMTWLGEGGWRGGEGRGGVHSPRSELAYLVTELLFLILGYSLKPNVKAPSVIRPVIVMPPNSLHQPPPYNAAGFYSPLHYQRNLI